MKLRLGCSDKLQTMQEDSGGEDCAFYLGNHRGQAARRFFPMRIQETGAGACSEALFLSGHSGFYFILNIFPSGHGRKAHPSRPACHQCINVRKKGGGNFCTHAKLEQSEDQWNVHMDSECLFINHFPVSASCWANAAE